MEAAAIEQLAADTLLDRGARMQVRAPFWLRCLGKRRVTLTITSPYEGTLLRVASYYLSTGISGDALDNISQEQALRLLALHGGTISKAVACAWLNGYWKGKLFTKPVAAWLRWHAKPEEMLTLLYLVINHGGLQAFIDTTRLLRTTRITAPKQLGQKDKGR